MWSSSKVDEGSDKKNKSREKSTKRKSMLMNEVWKGRETKEHTTFSKGNILRDA